MKRIQRTLLVSLGEKANRVAMETWQQLAAPVVLHVPLSPVTDPEAKEAMAAMVLAALQSISRVEVQAEMEACGLLLDPLDEIALWLLLDVEAVMGMEVALEARRLLADLVWRHFRCSLDTRVLIIAAPEKTSETRTLLTALAAEAPPPALAFLVSTVNRQGLSLTEEALCARLPLALRWLLAAPLRDEVHNASSSTSMPLLSLGVAVYPDPAAMVLNWCVQRWQAQALALLLAPVGPETLLPTLPAADEARRWLLPWPPESLYEALLALTDACWQRRPQPDGRHPGRWLWAQAESAMITARKDDETERHTFQTEAIALCDRWARQRREDLQQRLRLAAMPAGGMLDLDKLQHVLTICRRRWQDEAQVWESELSRAETERQACEEGLRAAETALRTLLQPVVGSTTGRWLPFWLIPRYWPWMIRAYWELPEAIRTYEAAHTSWRRSVLTALRMDRMRQDCLVAAQDVAAAQAHLERLQQALSAAREALTASADPEAWKAFWPFDRDDVLRLYDHIMGDGRTALAHCLQRYPVVDWTATPAGVLEALERFGRHWLSPLLSWGADRFVAYALHDDETALQAWWQGLWAQATPLWPGGLRRDEAVGTAVALVAPETSPLAALLAQTETDLLVLPTRPPAPLTVIRWQRLEQHEVMGDW